MGRVPSDEGFIRSGLQRRDSLWVIHDNPSVYHLGLMQCLIRIERVRPTVSAFRLCKLSASDRLANQIIYARGANSTPVNRKR